MEERERERLDARATEVEAMERRAHVLSEEVRRREEEVGRRENNIRERGEKLDEG